MELPALQAEEIELRAAMLNHLRLEIGGAGGRLPFDRYMELALYAPGLGYYVNGRRRFGERGDFVTAPEVSPLFAQCIATQFGQVADSLPGAAILEVGAGSGVLAAELLAELDIQACLPGQYAILEVSPDLQQQQRETLLRRVPHLLSRVRWLRDLPDAGFRGLVLANELLDALPVHRFRWSGQRFEEGFVTLAGDALVGHWDTVDSAALASALADLDVAVDGFPADYESEVNLRLAPWLEALGKRLAAAVVLLFDYGYPRGEYYLPERRRGTLMCHYRHRAHADPFLLPGLQDITAHVDFSAVALDGAKAGLALAGYTTQAHFLLDTGLDRRVMASNPEDIKAHLALVQGMKKLMLPTGMGELFKAIALHKGLDAALLGFRSRDLRGRL